MKFKFVKPLITISLRSLPLVGLAVLGNATIAQTQSFETQNCPDTFYTLPLFPDAKLCQLFEHGLPASLVYHAATSQQNAQAFYAEQLGDADLVKDQKGRIFLEYSTANAIIVLSKDGNGTQVDILVKSDA